MSTTENTTTPTVPTEVNLAHSDEVVADQPVSDEPVEVQVAEGENDGDVDDQHDVNSIDGLEPDDLAPGDQVLSMSPEQLTLTKLKLWFPQAEVQSKWTLDSTNLGNIICELIGHSQSHHMKLVPELNPLTIIDYFSSLVNEADVPTEEQNYDGPALAYDIFTNRGVINKRSCTESWHGRFRMDQRATQQNPRNATTYFIALCDRMDALTKWLSNRAYGFKGEVSKKVKNGKKGETVTEIEDVRAWKNRRTEHSNAVFELLDALSCKITTYNDEVKTHYAEFIKEADLRAEEARDRRAKAKEAEAANVDEPQNSGRVTEVKHNPSGSQERRPNRDERRQSRPNRSDRDDRRPNRSEYKGEKKQVQTRT